jgi:hypothetical protein
MSRPRRPRIARGSELTANEWNFLTDQKCADETRGWEWWALTADCTSFREDRLSVADLWAEYSPDVMVEWIEANPGTRPSLWWRYSAPRAAPTDVPTRWFDDTPPPVPRLRLGGIGVGCHECLAHGLVYSFGIPGHWLNQELADFYNGRSKGGRVTHAKEGDFPWPAVDPEDPPVFESQAAYLLRHGLLHPGERERLTDLDFALEAIGCADE